MVSNGDTNLCNKRVVGEVLFGSDFAIMCASHIAYLFVCVCVKDKTWLFFIAHCFKAVT
jgi:hypothetical protein